MLYGHQLSNMTVRSTEQLKSTQYVPTYLSPFDVEMPRQDPAFSVSAFTSVVVVSPTKSAAMTMYLIAVSPFLFEGADPAGLAGGRLTGVKLTSTTRGKRRS